MHSPENTQRHSVGPTSPSAGLEIREPCWAEGKTEMGKVLVIDIDKCNGCYNCQVACKDEHVGNDWSPIAKPQPDTGHFWMKVTDHGEER